MNWNSNQPASLSPRSSENEQQINVDQIIQKSKIENCLDISNIQQPGQLKLQSKVSGGEYQCDEKQLDEIQLQMLVQECEQLISKISPNIHTFYMHQQTTVLSDAQQSFSMKRQKNRLEKEYIQLCLEIQRQQKQLQNYRFKVQVAQKQAEYYSRQIKQKSAILQNLEQHTKKGRQSFRK